MTKIDELEKEAERVLPKRVNKEVKRHFLLFILGVLLILVLASYFAITYAKNAKDTKRQQNLLQQQIDLQRKQLEDAKKNTTAPTTTTIPNANTPTATTSKTTPTTKCTMAYVDAKMNESKTRWKQEIDNIAKENNEDFATARQGCDSGEVERDGVDCISLLTAITDATGKKYDKALADHKARMEALTKSCE
jgi:cell division protein FtsN